MRQPEISIGLVIRNEAHQIAELLTQLKEITLGSLHEVLIVDNNSTDLTLKIVNDWQIENPDFKLRLLKNHENHMATARNKILEECSAEWVYFIDADCRLSSSVWEKWISFLQRKSPDQKIAAFGGGNKPLHHRGFINNGIHLMSRNWWGHMNSIQIRPPQKEKPVDLLSTCNLLVRKTAAKACQGFDTHDSRVGEDLSFCHRLKQSGYHLIALPEVDVFHIQNRSLLKWYKKIFFYGRAQVQVGSRYSNHLIGLRGLQLAAIFLFLAGFTFFGLQTFYFAVFYFCILVCGNLICSEISLTKSLLGALFIFTSQAAYALGELYAVLLIPVSLLYLPIKIPILDKK